LKNVALPGVITGVVREWNKEMTAVAQVTPHQHTDRIQPTDPVRFLMKPSLAVLNVSDTLQDAVDELARNEIGIALIGDDEVLGLISERDIISLLSMRVDLATTQLGEVLTCDVVWAAPTTSINDVGALMIEAGVRHIPVGDGNKSVGIVSIRDILAVLLPA
jgi:CBS domain-containing protein